MFVLISDEEGREIGEGFGFGFRGNAEDWRFQDCIQLKKLRISQLLPVPSRSSKISSLFEDLAINHLLFVSIFVEAFLLALE